MQVLRCVVLGIEVPEYPVDLRFAQTHDLTYVSGRDSVFPSVEQEIEFLIGNTEIELLVANSQAEGIRSGRSL